MTPGFFRRSRSWITSATSAALSGSFTSNRPMIFEKSFPLDRFISPMIVSISCWAVTTIQARPRQRVFRLSAIVWRFVISRTLSAMYWPTSSTKKFSRNPGSVFSWRAM